MRSMTPSHSNRSMNIRTLLLSLPRATSISQKVSKGTEIYWLIFPSRSSYPLYYDLEQSIDDENRTDIITLQNPHALPSVSVPTVASTSSSSTKATQPATGSKDAKAVSKPAPVGPVAAAKKAAEPCQFCLCFGFLI